SGNAPQTGDTLIFGPGAAQLTNVNDLVGRTFNTIDFTSAGYSISGNAITLSGIIDASGATGANTFNLNLTLGAASTIKGGGIGTSFSEGGTINNGGFLLTVNGAASGTVTLGGAISGSGGLTDADLGTLIVSGGNSYSGVTTLSASSILQVNTNT